MTTRDGKATKHDDRDRVQQVTSKPVRKTARNRSIPPYYEFATHTEARKRKLFRDKALKCYARCGLN